MLDECPKCHSPISEYHDDDFTAFICWNCGYYASDSPAYRLHPEWFENMVRDNSLSFMKKLLKIVPLDVGKQINKLEEKVTKPNKVTQVTVFHMKNKISKVTKTSQNLL